MTPEEAAREIVNESDFSALSDKVRLVLADYIYHAIRAARIEALEEALPIVNERPGSATLVIEALIDREREKK